MPGRTSPGMDCGLLLLARQGGGSLQGGSQVQRTRGNGFGAQLGSCRGRQAGVRTSAPGVKVQIEAEPGGHGGLVFLCGPSIVEGRVWMVESVALGSRRTPGEATDMAHRF